MEPLKAYLTNAYDAISLGRRRANERGKPTKDEPILHPRLSIVAATTPGFYEDSLDEVDLREGFMARFTTFRAERERLKHIAKYDTEQENVLAAVLKDYAGSFGLQRMPGRCCGFDDEAAAIWTAWLDENERKVRSEPSAIWTAGVARAHGHALKIALLLSWDYGQARQGADGVPWYVTTAELVPAIEIARWHIGSVQAIAATLASDHDMRARRRVLNAISSKPTPFGKIVKTAQVTSRRAKELLQTLQDEGTITSVMLEGAGFCYVLSDGTGFQGTDLGPATTPLDGDAAAVPPTNPSEADGTRPTPLD
jgi:hypothetical protein